MLTLLFVAVLSAHQPVTFVQAHDTARLSPAVQLELERSKAAMRREIDDKLGAELVEHRKYLQDLNDRFYSAISLWLPIGSGLIAAFFAFFLWHVGKTQREAFENAQFIAVSKATELAQAKVNSIVIPDEIIRKAKELSDATAVEIGRLREELVDNVRSDLTAARDDIVHNKHELIERTLNEALSTQFADQLDVMSRITKLEERMVQNDKRDEEIRDLLAWLYSTSSFFTEGRQMGGLFPVRASSYAFGTSPFKVFTPGARKRLSELEKLQEELKRRRYADPPLPDQS